MLESGRETSMITEPRNRQNLSKPRAATARAFAAGLDHRNGAAIEVAAHFEQVEKLGDLSAIRVHFDEAAALEPPGGEQQGGRCRGRRHLRQQQGTFVVAGTGREIGWTN